ncbi:MAG: hypothetical protein ACYC7A_03990 [Thermoanaerobaculia bacterium]
MSHHFSRNIIFVVAAAAALAIACGKEAARSPEAHANHQQPAPSATAAHGGTSAVVPTLPTTPPAASPVTPLRADVVFSGTRDETERFIAYYQSIHLTPEQERVKVEALASIPAPCCSDNPLATCCCPCNMAKAAWGLSAWLIGEKSFDAVQVRQAAKDWLAAANPGGFSGDACDTGGCSRPIHENGCGGMNDKQVL